jgi:lysophospholipase L1-like esterase
MNTHTLHSESQNRLATRQLHENAREAEGRQNASRKYPSRRSFLGNVSLAAASGFAGAFAGTPSNLYATNCNAKNEKFFQSGDILLFQGDSITDVKRNRDSIEPNSQSALGNGYAWFVAAELLIQHEKEKLKVFNRGIGGDTVQKMNARWKKDCLDLQPDVLSILIGFNDYNHYRKGKYNGGVETYAKDYRDLMRKTRDALPDVQLVICEPFVIDTGKVKPSWKAEINEFQIAAEAVATDFGAIFVRFQDKFDMAVELAPADYWATDGIHPTPAAAAFMARWWLEALNKTKVG